MINLTTNTLIKTLLGTTDWRESADILRTIQTRRDIYNLEPLLEFAVNPTTPSHLRRLALEVADGKNPDFTISWIENRAKDRFRKSADRRVALQALADLHQPNKTLPALEEIATCRGAHEVRVAALTLIAKFGNLRSVPTLLSLKQARDEKVVSQAATVALEELLARRGGRAEAVSRMLDYAKKQKAQGQKAIASKIMSAARTLDPGNGALLYAQMAL